MEKYRQAIFIVTFARTNKGIRYVLLKRKKHWTGWEFPKGGIDPGEDKYTTAYRETKEETGHKPERVLDFNIEGKYEYKKDLSDRPGVIGQTYHLFAAEIPKKKILFDESEHLQSQWMDYTSAKNKLTFRNQKDCLKVVNDWLEEEKKFRKIKLPSGKILLSGKDKETNEKLVIQSGENEQIFHTEKPGSPFCVIKKIPVEEPFNLKEPKKEDIRQAAIFCASKSQDWRDNKSDVTVHLFSGKDVFKKKGMNKGCFSLKDFRRIKVKKSEIIRYIGKKH